MGEHGSRHDVESNVVALAKDVVHGSEALESCSMGKHLTAVSVADGINTVDGSFHVVIDQDALFVVGNAHGVQI